jgi:hypothetical protein
MKIYILPVNEIIQPNSTWYGLEQDFLKYLHENDNLVTLNSQEADYHYLPVFWGRLFHTDLWNTDLLKKYVTQAILNDSNTFTIAQSSHGTPVDMGKTIIFQASRCSPHLNLPLLRSPYEVPDKVFEKKYLASFVGRLGTHSIRYEMAECFKAVSGTFIFDGIQGTDFFVEKILESYITLCPRGAAASSFRFFETMQLGVVPFLIGEADTRPFQKFINWDNYSFYAHSPKDSVAMVKNLRGQKNELLQMGKQCAKLWKEEITYGKWCPYIIKELSDL